MLERVGVPLWQQAVKREPSWRETRATFTSRSPLQVATAGRAAGEPQAECRGAQATCAEAVSMCSTGRKPTNQPRLIRAAATASCHKVTELFLLPILFGLKCPWRGTETQWESIRSSCTYGSRDPVAPCSSYPQQDWCRGFSWKHYVEVEKVFLQKPCRPFADHLAFTTPLLRLWRCFSKTKQMEKWM